MHRIKAGQQGCPDLASEGRPFCQTDCKAEFGAVISPKLIMMRIPSIVHRLFMLLANRNADA